MVKEEVWKYGTIDRSSTQYIKEFYKRLAEQTIKSFEKNNIKAYYVSDRKEAFKMLMEMIPEGASVSYGDSVTLHQIGIISELRKDGYNFTDPWAEEGLSYEKTLELRRKALTVDVFLSGTNAVTQDGKLVNIDGWGNRVAGLMFGPKKVIIVAGVNKIVKNVDEGVKRAREIAAPLNALRHGSDLGKPDSWNTGMYTAIIEGESHIYKEQRMHVIIIEEELGF